MKFDKIINGAVTVYAASVITWEVFKFSFKVLIIPAMLIAAYLIYRTVMNYQEMLDSMI